MTKLELNNILKQGIVKSTQQEKTLPEDLASTFVKWVHGLIKQGQDKQNQVMQNSGPNEDEQVKPQMQGA